MAPKSSSGGGAANYAGTNYQSRAMAWAAVQILAEQDVAPPWNLAAAVTLTALHAESPQPIDDLILTTSENGKVRTQVKHTVNLETTPGSPLGAAAAQFVEEFCTTTQTLDAAKDRFVLTTSPQSSAGLRVDLSAFLARMRTSSNPVDEWVEGSQAQRHAANVFRDHLVREWQENNKGVSPTIADLATISRLIYIHILDVDPGGYSERDAKNTLRQRILKDPLQADQAWNTLVTTVETYAANHQRADRAALQQALVQANFDLQAPRSFRSDIERLSAHTAATLQILADFSCIHMGNQIVKIHRAAVDDIQLAAIQGHLLILGTPGAGKSGGLHDFTQRLHNGGADVILFAAEQLEAVSTGALRNELGLAHELITVLAGWPGTKPGYLVIDALDAARTDAAIRTLYTIMGQVIAANSRWRVVASVRKFDLRYSPALQRLFSGTPPSAHRDPEFGTTRHVNVPTLTPAELQQVTQQAPILEPLITSAPTALRVLLEVPFNLRLLAELIGSGVTPAALHPLATQIELLDRYWRERIIRHDGNGDARETVLRRVTDAMVSQRTLRVARTSGTANDTTASPILTDLLSTHVLAEWTNTAGATQRDLLTFPHHLLFDYAVARLTIPQDNKAFVTRLATEQDLLIAIRPSIELHYQRLWQNARESFWDLTFRAIRASLPEIGKLIGPNTAALHAQTISDYQPLLSQLDDTSPSSREDGMRALRHLLVALVANARTTNQHAASPWCALLDEVSATMTPDRAYAIRPSVWLLAERTSNLSTPELLHLGAIARRLFAYALTLAPNDNGLIAAGITAVTSTAATDPAGSINALRGCITPQHLTTMGHRTLYSLAQGVPGLLGVDAGFVHDTYVAALRHRDTSKAATLMGNSQIMPFRSDQQQDFKTGLHQLGKHFPTFLATTPAIAIRTLLDVLDDFSREHHNTSTQQFTVQLDQVQATLISDRSHSWDSMAIYEHDLPITMLGDLNTRLTALADEDDTDTIWGILGEITATALPAVVWRRLLFAATNRPAIIGRMVRSLAWDRTIITHPDTTRVVGDFIRVIHPLVENVDKERIERAILAISIEGSAGTYDRDRLLGCVDSGHIVTSEARVLREHLARGGGPPSNVETGGAFWQAVPPTLRPADAIQPFLDPIEDFSTNRNEVPDQTAVKAILLHINSLDQAIIQQQEHLTEERLTHAITALISAVLRVAFNSALTEAQCTQLLPVVITATSHPQPEAEEHEDKAKPVQGWSDTPRICAAEALVLLSRYPSGCSAEGMQVIERLSADPVPSVRLQVATRLACLRNTAREFLWQVLEARVRKELNPSVLVRILQTLRSLSDLDVGRAGRLAECIRMRIPADVDHDHVRDACIHLFTAFCLQLGEATSATIVDGLVDDVTQHPRDLHRLILDLSLAFTAKDQSVRDTAFALVRRALSNIIAAMRAIEQNNQVTPWPDAAQESYGGLLRSADEVALRLFLACESYNDPNHEAAFMPLADFYAVTHPLLALLTGVGHPHSVHHVVDALKHFIAIDPAGVLLLVRDLVKAGSRHGYQYEQLAEELIVGIVERYLAEYRPIIRERPDCHVALMDILDVFVLVGSPRAYQLTYQLSEIYR